MIARRARSRRRKISKELLQAESKGLIVVFPSTRHPGRWVILGGVRNREEAIKAMEDWNSTTHALNARLAHLILEEDE